MSLGHRCYYILASAISALVLCSVTGGDLFNRIAPFRGPAWKQWWCQLVSGPTRSPYVHTTLKIYAPISPAHVSAVLTPTYVFLTSFIFSLLILHLCTDNNPWNTCILGWRNILTPINHVLCWISYSVALPLSLGPCLQTFEITSSFAP